MSIEAGIGISNPSASSSNSSFFLNLFYLYYIILRSPAAADALPPLARLNSACYSAASVTTSSKNCFPNYCPIYSSIDMCYFLETVEIAEARSIKDRQLTLPESAGFYTRVFFYSEPRGCFTLFFLAAGKSSKRFTSSFSSSKFCSDSSSSSLTFFSSVSTARIGAFFVSLTFLGPPEVLFYLDSEFLFQSREPPLVSDSRAACLNPLSLDFLYSFTC